MSTCLSLQVSEHPPLPDSPAREILVETGGVFLPVDDDRIGWRLVSVSTALFVTTPTAMRKSNEVYSPYRKQGQCEDGMWHMVHILISALLAIISYYYMFIISSQDKMQYASYA